MAAAEYFAPGPLHGQSAAHPQQTQAAASAQQLQPTSNYSSSPSLRPQQGGPPPPPPYSPFEEPQRPRPQGVHFAPTPPQLQQHHQRHSFSDQHRPSIPQSSSAHQMYNHPQHQNSSYPVVNYNASSANLHAPYPQSTSQYNGSSMNLASYYPPQPQKQYYTQQSSAPHMRPYANANYSTTNLMGGNQPVQGGYTSDPEPHRRRRRRRSHEDKHKRDRSRERDAKDSRSTKKDATVGAVAGGLIGDLIFPGLGSVVAGAGLGWLGGKDYGKHRKWREEKLEKEQKQWEDKYRKSSRDEGRESHRDGRRDHDDDGDFYYGGSRSRGHSDSGYRGRESSYSQPPPQFLGEKGRTQSYERRNSHY